MTNQQQLKSTRYPVSEHFASFQGEGLHAGRSSYFIRTYGCPVKCPWCDSADTWRPELRPANLPRLSVDELVDLATSARPEFVVITGGEPTIHDLRPLTDALHACGLPVHLETSGAFTLKGDFDWVTVSPKAYQAPLPENIARANELKLIIENQVSIDYWEAQLGSELTRPDRPVWLHPEWSLHEDPATLSLIANTVSQRGAPFRAGWQIHKLYRVR